MPKLTEQVIRSLELPPKGNRIIYDEELKGFGIRITAAGAKSFVLNYRAQGIERRITIGSHPDWKVAAAREQAKELKRQIDLGHDPMGERHDERNAPCVIDLWERYAREHLPNKSIRAQQDDRSMFKAYILPSMGKKKVAAITHAEVDALHDQISEYKKIRANRVVEVLRKAFNLSIRWGWRADNPASGVRRNPEEKRERYLTPTEIAALLSAIDQHSSVIPGQAIRFMLLTGARKGEVLNATWKQFDLESGIWTKPAATTKQRKEHRVPLSAPALDLLRALNNSGEYIFPGTMGKPLVDIRRAWQAICVKAGLKSVRIHDLRHTYASILASEGLSLPIIGALLGHTQTQTTARYSHLLDDPLRVATAKVGNLVDTLGKK